MLEVSHVGTENCPVGEFHRIAAQHLRRVRIVTDVPVIAIVDDDESFRRALARFLGTFAFCVRTFASGEEFLQSSELGLVECLLLDLVMPGMSGLEVKQQLEVRGLGIPTVFVTAHADDGVEQHLFAAGAIAILRKPLDQQTLLRLVQGVVGKR
jgi:FixJ family two-component response regulator